MSRSRLAPLLQSLYWSVATACGYLCAAPRTQRAARSSC